MMSGYKPPEWDTEAFAKDAIIVLHNMALAHESPWWLRWLRRLDWHIAHEHPHEHGAHEHPHEHGAHEHPHGWPVHEHNAVTTVR